MKNSRCLCGEVFAAAVIALEGEDPRRIEQVCAAVEAAPDKLGGKVAGLLESDSPLWRQVGIAACAVHRVDCGEHLSRALEDPDPTLRARALRAVGETARRDLLPVLRGQKRLIQEAECLISPILDFDLRPPGCTVVVSTAHPTGSVQRAATLITSYALRSRRASIRTSLF